jgi:linoleoyl-CoA desaturase
MDRGSAGMYAKTAILGLWLVASYLLLLFASDRAWQASLLAASLGLAIAGIGFNVQHDGSHGSYSPHGRVNGLMALALDLLGGSSYAWRLKHNLLHHTWPNEAGVDDDINIGWLGRLSPAQPRLLLHRFQHFYLWPLYGFLTVKWQLFDDFRFLATGRIGGQQFERPRGTDLAIFLGGKLVFFGWAFALPLMLHPPGLVIAVYLATAFVAGLTLSVVFQLAHCVPEAATPSPASPWAVRQVEASVDFAKGSRLLAWYLGGLNFQTEHHLFPQVCHVHYPSLAPIVEEVCRSAGVRYIAYPTLGSALRAHFRLLRQLGRPETSVVGE